MNSLYVEELQPIGDGLWKAEIVVKNEEDINGIGVAQVSTLRVRFTYDVSDSVEGLLQRALDEARRCLSLSSAYMQEKGLPELFEQLERKPAWDGNIDFQFDPQP